MTRTSPLDDLATVHGRLEETRLTTEALAAPLSESDQTVQSMPDTSPTKWHRAHTTWFFETFVLGEHLPGYTPFDEHFSYLFNSYYEGVGDRYPRVRRGLVTRPGIERIAEYRRHVDRGLHALIDGADRELAAVITPLLDLGVHHEQQHQELLLMDIKHVLENNLFDTAYDARRHTPVADPGPIRWRSIEGGLVAIGFDDEVPDQPPFHFDNEEPRHDALVPSFRLADRLVTCGEWLAFMADGGYETATLWLSDGWHKSRSEGWTAPLYWHQDHDGQWMIHTLTGRRPIDPNEPVCHVSFYEADAYANWAGARLPTEFEWERASTEPQTAGATLAHHQPDGPSTVSLSRLHPDGAGAPSDAPDGGPVLRQLTGDCWEWTGSPYRPYPGFRAADGAIGEYNGKFMINTMVLRGGCALTPAGHLRPTYRNFFHPHTRWHLSGVRLAND
ncbi:MAG: ergothioneine biosynthesis protein EgtB [Actinomycetota bacterium]